MKAALFALLLLLSLPAVAEVPRLINYQGRIAVGNVNFAGPTGKFKFAFIVGEPTIRATATARRFDEFITGYTLTNPGAGYTSVPAITVTGGGGSGATATTVITAGRVTDITALTAGSGYTSLPAVSIAPPPRNQFLWNSDGAPLTSDPVNAVTLPVANGLYSVLLGDTAIPNMTAIPPEVFGNPDVRLRVWFDDGVRGFQQFIPDQRLTASGYALRAHQAESLTGSLNAGNIPLGLITGDHLAPGAVEASLNSGDGTIGLGLGGTTPAVGIGTASPSNPLTVSFSAGSPVGGTPGFPEVIARVQRTGAGGHSALSIDANTGQDSILYLAENGQAQWGLRHDSDDGHAFQLRYQAGGANATMLRVAPSGDTRVAGSMTTGKFNVITPSTSSPATGAILTPATGFVRLTPAAPVVLNPTTAIAAGTTPGQVLILQGTSNTNTVTINDQGTIELGSTRILGANDMLTLMWDGFEWIETAWANN